MIFSVFAFLSCCAVGSSHSPVSLGNGAASEEVTLHPKELRIELGQSDKLKISFKSHLERNVTVEFLYDYGDGELRKDPGEIIAALDNITLSAGETAVLDVQATKPGNVFVVCTSNEIDIPTSMYTTIDVERSIMFTIIAVIVGWAYFAVWTIAYYPQVVSNFRRKSVIGLNFDFVGLNMIGQIAYVVFTVGLFWIQLVQEQYLQRHPRGIIPVEANDVVYTLNGLFVNLIIIVQCISYERGGQRMSWTGIALSIASCIFMAVTGVLGAVDVMEWLDVLYYASYVKLFITLIRCIPQVYMNFRRKSTRGFNIWFALLEIIGGVFSILQMVLIAYNHDDWDSMVGNPTKFLHGILTMLFDVVFIVQHYCLYRHPLSEEKPLLKKANAVKVDSRC